MIIQKKSPEINWYFSENLLYPRPTLKKMLAHLATATILAINDD
jgi:hypothetical protein